MSGPFPEDMRDRKVAYGRTCPLCLRPIDHGGHTKIGGGGGPNYVEEQYRCDIVSGKHTEPSEPAKT